MSLFIIISFSPCDKSPKYDANHSKTAGSQTDKFLFKNPLLTWQIANKMLKKKKEIYSHSQICSVFTSFSLPFFIDLGFCSTSDFHKITSIYCDCYNKHDKI